MKVEDYLKTSHIKNNFIFKLSIKVLVTIITVLSILITSKTSPKFNSFITPLLFETNYNFAKINSLYKKYILNIKNNPNLAKVGKEKVLEYKSKKDYKEGVLLEVDEMYNVKLLESGLVVYVGEKDGVRSSIVVKQSNGIDLIYGFINNPNVKVYDYVEKGTIIGTANKELYLAFQKEGEQISYAPYIE